MSEPAATQKLGVADIMEVGGYVLDIVPIAIPKPASDIPQDAAGCDVQSGSRTSACTWGGRFGTLAALPLLPAFSGCV